MIVQNLLWASFDPKRKFLNQVGPSLLCCYWADWTCSLIGLGPSPIFLPHVNFTKNGNCENMIHNLETFDRKVSLCE